MRVAWIYEVLRAPLRRLATVRVIQALEDPARPRAEIGKLAGAPARLGGGEALSPQA
jgi:hypothetical protein